MGDAGETDVGDYCRRVERHLTMVNDGHLVRIVGPSFALVRRWAEDGVPLSIVLRGIDRKAERHRLGQSTRPLRLEFCEGDVNDEHNAWRRAVGLFGASPTSEAAEAESGSPDANDGGERRLRGSLARHIERACDRLADVASRSECPDEARARIESCLADLRPLAEQARRARGDTRQAILAALRDLDAQLGPVADGLASPALRTRVREEAEVDLAPYRGRLLADAWERSVSVSAARALRAQLGVPVLDPLA